MLWDYTDDKTKERLEALLFLSENKITSSNRERVVDLLYDHLVDVVSSVYPEANPVALLNFIKQPTSPSYLVDLWTGIWEDDELDLDTFVDDVLKRVRKYQEAHTHHYDDSGIVDFGEPPTFLLEE